MKPETIPSNEKQLLYFASFYTTVGACYCYENYNECVLEQRWEVDTLGNGSKCPNRKRKEMKTETTPSNEKKWLYFAIQVWL